jgi:aminopeptidase N
MHPFFSHFRYFDVAFPLPKLDMIAIPDFAAGAMENWGLVTYRDTALLWDTVKSSASAKERVAYVVAHELAHQWFGNLVSPEWWAYLWLNEGFATWAGNLAVNELFPHWQTWTKFVGETVSAAFRADGLLSSHPIEVTVNDAGMISEIFDAISYHKGSSVIRMLANNLGGEVFRDGLRTYLKAKQYACATTEDLWAHCSAASGKDVASMMNNWVQKMGYPFVTVRSLGVTGGQLSLEMTQQRYLATGELCDDDTVTYTPLHSVIRILTYTHTHTHTHTHTCANTRTNILSHAHTRTHAHVQTHKDTDTSVHTHTHTHTPTSRSGTVRWIWSWALGARSRQSPSSWMPRAPPSLWL